MIRIFISAGAAATLCCMSVFFPVMPAAAQTGYECGPVSGADGVFDIVSIDGQTVYRSIKNNGRYQYYMYFRCSKHITNRTAWLEITYLDTGYGNFRVQYNSNSHDYQMTTTGFENFVLDSGRERTAVFELPDADFRSAQNLQSDFRLVNDGSLQMHIISAVVYPEPPPLFLEHDEDWISPYSGPVYTGDHIVDAGSLNRKVICGYQGWFRAAGDPGGTGWVHYVHGDFDDVTVEMWPDMLEYSTEEKYPVPGWTHADNSQAYLFSSANKKTVLRHFQWMETYGIDGVAVQRFVSGLDTRNPKESFRIPGYAREAANRTGRTFFIMYDMSGYAPDRCIGLMNSDWRYMVDEMKITQDSRYLHHNGRPVVGLFGFFSDRFSAADGNKLLDVFQNSSPYSAFVIGSGQWWWRTETAAGWPDVFRRMDAWIPWNCGNYSGDYARTDYWELDKTTLEAAGVIYMPLVYPGFSWDNLQNLAPGTSYKSRMKGRFLWDQLLRAKDIEAQTVYVAMFDEIDEGTAIFKVTNDVPVNHYFIGLEGLPSDYYLLMTGYGTQMIRGNVAVPPAIPDFVSQSQPSVPEVLSPVYGDSVANDVVFSWSASKHTSGIFRYILEIDGKRFSTTDTIHTRQLADGKHDIKVRAINGLKNKGGWSERIAFNVIHPSLVGPAQLKPQKGFILSQNHPNPFNNTTVIEYHLPGTCRTELVIYDILGSEVVKLIDKKQGAGDKRIQWDGRNRFGHKVTSGVYIYRIVIKKKQKSPVFQTRKMLFIN